MIDNTKCFGYCRLSGLGQAAKNKDGTKRQRETIQTYATANGLTVEQWFEDVMSGTKDTFERPALTDLFATIKSNGVRCVLVENADRIGRDLMVSEIILSEFRKIGVKVIAADSGQDLTVADEEPTRKLIRQILCAIAEFDKSRIVQKLRAARMRKKRSGARVEGRKPYGSRAGELEVLTQMEVWRGEGINFSEIARRLNAQGIKPRVGVQWYPTTVQNILKRSAEQS